MRLNFNRFSINSQWWKNAISNGNFYRIRIWHCLIFLQSKFGDNQKLKTLSSQLRKNYFSMLNIKRPIAHQSSIIFFDTLCRVIYPWSYTLNSRRGRAYKWLLRPRIVVHDVKKLAKL